MALVYSAEVIYGCIPSLHRCFPLWTSQGDESLEPGGAVVGVCKAESALDKAFVTLCYKPCVSFCKELSLCQSLAKATEPCAKVGKAALARELYELYPKAISQLSWSLASCRTQDLVSLRITVDVLLMFYSCFHFSHVAIRCKELIL